MESYVRGPQAQLIEQSIPEVLHTTAARFPNAPALVVRHQNLRWSWQELAAEAERTARALRGLGLAPGDRAGVWATNCYEWVTLQLGAAQAGVVLVNVNPAYRASELAFVLRKSGMKALFLRRADARSAYGEILAEARRGEELPLRDTVYFGEESWERFLAGGKDLAGYTAANRDPVNIQYTSGTTGFPKGVVLTHRNLINNGWLVGQGLRYTERDRIVVPVPLYHCFGCVMGVLAAVATGAAMILPNWTFEAGATLEAIAAERGTSIYGVPTMFIAMLDHPAFGSFDLGSLRTGIMAGSPCPIEVMKRVVNEMGAREMTIAYGQTESSPVITSSRVEDPLELRVSTVGCAMPETEVKIIDAAGRIVPAGEQGELCTRGYLVMQGYDGEPEATARAIDAEGWLHTGDLATMRPDGYFRITGRAKDMIIRGGENIYPREIEEFYYTHPKVADVQVVGLPDLKYGETVLAWIRLKPGESATEEEMREFAKARIAHFKVPQYVRFVDEFPMTVTGKIQKYAIRQAEIRRLGLEKAAGVETA
jgi:fatty-acyl-CoA synthase